MSQRAFEDSIINGISSWVVSENVGTFSLPGIILKYKVHTYYHYIRRMDTIQLYQSTGILYEIVHIISYNIDDITYI